MRKSEFLALSGAAALCFAVSPILTNTSSALAVPEETINIDDVDITNGTVATIEDENLAKYVNLMVEREGDDDSGALWCVYIDEENSTLKTSTCEDGEPLIQLYTMGNKVGIHDENPTSNLIIYDDITINAHYVDGIAVTDAEFLYYVENRANAEGLLDRHFNISKLFTGLGTAFISGEDQTYIKGSEEGLVVHTTSEVDNLASVVVDGEELNEEYYTAEDGSIILTLKADYLNDLKAGRHTLKLNFNWGEALTTSFTIEANPETSDLPASVVITFIVCTFLSTATMAYMEISKKIRR